MMSQLKEVIVDVRAIDGKEKADEVKEKYKNFESILESCSDEHWQDVRDLIVACVQCDHEDIIKLAVQLFTKRKLIQWKEHVEVFDALFDTLLSANNNGAASNTKRVMMANRDVLKQAAVFLKSFNLLKKYNDRFYEIIVAAMQSTTNRLILCARPCTEHVDWPKNPDKIKAVMERIYEIVIEHPTMPYKDDFGRMVIDTCHAIFGFLWPTGKVYKQASLAISESVTKVFIHCADAEWDVPSNREEQTINYHLCKTIMKDYVNWNRDETKAIKQMFEKILVLREECDDGDMVQLIEEFFETVGGNIAQLMGDKMGDIIDEFIEEPSATKAYQLYEAIMTDKKPFKTRVNEIAEAIFDSGDPRTIKDGYYIVWEMTKKFPMGFSKEVVEKIAQAMPGDEYNQQWIGCLGELAKTRKRLILEFDDAIIACLYRSNGTSTVSSQLLINLTSFGKEYAAKYIAVFVECIKKFGGIVAQNHTYYLGTIGAKYPDELAVHKDFITGYIMNDPSLKEYAINALNIVEGRSLHGVSETAKEQKEDIKRVDEKVTETDKQADIVKKEVKTINKNVKEVKSDVDEQSEKLNELEHVVEETVEKVEEMDKKTLSHAPKWSRDVSKLLNKEAEQDWRCLATKLGYSNDDIRSWTTQPDPCLSLLDEWFATHTNREAILAVEKALNEMNRTDAVVIVENALKMAEHASEEEDEDEDWNPPPIFISYQWSHQEQVALLHKHLKMAGYKSWMDTGQSGGGDKLIEKIDRGIRTAKVIICCISEQYAQSANCNREVNMSVTLGKPMIPLLMEKMPWPPAGSMGPIFGEYIFVRFFARAGETAGDERYWPTAKFQELLMQLRFTHAPEQSVVTSELYRNWWDPPQEIIVIKPRTENKTQATSCKADEKAEEESPEVFISYQWGKQPQIKELYKTLTSKGYMCWLDIMQMGGGDSLYDKIDKGIRGCKVVISCVTSKYALSANCRREVSLADAVKKPIVPLLLEECPWPPEGPMSKVFTPLAYIDFCKPDIGVQNSWNCPQVDELYTKLIEHVPRMKPLKAITTDTKTPEAKSKTSNEEESTAFDENAETYREETTPISPNSSEHSDNNGYFQENKSNSEEPNISQSTIATNNTRDADVKHAKSSSCAML